MRRLWTPGWVLVHVAALVLVVGFLWLGWWQVQRAASGNLLSFGYAIEWPVFAGFVIFVWLKEVRRALRPPAGSETSDATIPTAAPAAVSDLAVRPATRTSARPAVRHVRNGPAYDDSEDEELAAYNRYLAWLNAHPNASPSDYPG